MPALIYTHRQFVVLLAGLLLFCQSALADIPTGSKRVVFENRSGESFELGSIEISRSGDAYRFSFSLEEANFSDQFLSMRPFKCIDGEPMYCHLAYPYSKPETFTAADFVNLEYEFLFIVRSPKEYGIDPYNGRYYKFRVEDGEQSPWEPRGCHGCRSVSDASSLGA